MPLSFCQRMSVWPLPSKSPVLATCQLLGTEPAPATMCPPEAWLLFQIAAEPSSLNQKTSLVPLPSKSPAAAICQLLGTAPALAITCPLVDCPLSQIATEPLSFCQRILCSLPLKSSGSGVQGMIAFDAMADPLNS